VACQLFGHHQANYSGSNHNYSFQTKRLCGIYSFLFKLIINCGGSTPNKKSTKKSDTKPAGTKTGSLESPKISIYNIVVSADLHAVVDLYALSKEVKAVDYEPEQFPGAIFKISESRTVILFKNGKMICTGARTEPEVKSILEYVAKVMSKYVISLNPPEK
jgi:TATA-box binding protein (TBP) (component of TFIID and TFIIIB)